MVNTMPMNGTATDVVLRAKDCDIYYGSYKAVRDFSIDITKNNGRRIYRKCHRRANWWGNYRF